MGKIQLLLIKYQLILYSRRSDYICILQRCNNAACDIAIVDNEKKHTPAAITDSRPLRMQNNSAKW
jgi:hypothetical protein